MHVSSRLRRFALCTVLTLQAHRVAAQAVTRTEIVATTITHYYTMPAPTQPLSSQYTDDLDFRTSVLNSTNFYRYQHSASYLFWNATLARYAQDYSARCMWEHSRGANGENLAKGYTNVTAAVEAWGDERKDYNFDPSNPTGFTDPTGHFTQLVWRSTQSTGCGWTDCEGTNGLYGVFLVCEYWPPGNLIGNNNYWFKQNVYAERAGGGNGFDEFVATRGATGGVPTPTSDGSTGATASSGAGGETLGGIFVEGRSGNVWAAMVVTIAALLFGLGMS